MGALYHIKQRLVDFANVVQENLNRSDTVPSSKVLYDELTALKPKEATATRTTDNYGSVKLFEIADYPTRRVVSATAANNTRCVLFIGWNSSAYGVTIYDLASGQLITGTTITVKYTYVDV